MSGGLSVKQKEVRLSRGNNLFAVEIGRPWFADEQGTTLTIADGYLVGLTFNRPNEAAELMKTPVKMADAVIDGMTRSLTQIDKKGAAAETELLRAQAERIKAEADLLAVVQAAQSATGGGQSPYPAPITAEGGEAGDQAERVGDAGPGGGGATPNDGFRPLISLRLRPDEVTPPPEGGGGDDLGANPGGNR